MMCIDLVAFWSLSLESVGQLCPNVLSLPTEVVSKLCCNLLRDGPSFIREQGGEYRL